MAIHYLLFFKIYVAPSGIGSRAGRLVFKGHK